jgi:hypothetical protein
MQPVAPPLANLHCSGPAGHGYRWVAALVIACAGWNSEAEACNVPVFRYALERWPADAYLLFVLTDGPLDDAHQAGLTGFQQAAPRGVCRVEVIDVAQPLSPQQQQIVATVRSTIGELKLPWMVLLYPGSLPDEPPAYSGPLDGQVLGGLLDSPGRQQVADMLLRGESIVWLLVEGSDAQRNAAAARLIQHTLTRLQREIQLPELTADDARYLAAEALPELRLSLAMHRIGRADEAERYFVHLLDHWEPGPVSTDEPTVFAVFGRGRVLGPLPYARLTAENIEQACRYLCGACSCEIKNDNPGWDLLMAVDWDQRIAGRYTLAQAMPALTTPGGLADRNAGWQPDAPAAAAAPTRRLAASLALRAPAARNWTGPVVWSLCGLAAVVLCGTLFVAFKQRSGGTP